MYNSMNIIENKIIKINIDNSISKIKKHNIYIKEDIIVELKILRIVTTIVLTTFPNNFIIMTY